MAISAPEPTVLTDGLGLGESPRWHEGRLWFSDWVDQTVQALDPEGGPEVITKVASMPFSIDWLPGGPMLITSGSRSFARTRTAPLTPTSISAICPTTAGTRSSSTGGATPT